MRIKVMVSRLVINGGAGTDARSYGSRFVAALESGLARANVTPAVTDSRSATHAAPMRTSARAGAGGAGAATASAISRALRGGTPR
jgi:hypothetical protein